MEKTSLSASSLEELNDIIRSKMDAYSIQFHQQKAGLLDYTHRAIRLGSSDQQRPVAFELSHHKYGLQLGGFGTTPRHSFSILVPEGPVPISVCGRKVTQGELLIIRPGDEVDFVLPTGATFFDLHMEQCAVRDIFSRAKMNFDDTQIAQLLPGDWQTLFRLLRSCLYDSECENASADTSVSAQLTEATIGCVLKASGHRDRAMIGRSEQGRIARLAREWMHATLDRPVTTPQLCEVTGSKARTLQMAFKDRFGISPVAYHRTIRLHAARSDLMSTEKDTNSVTKIASTRGFAHLGRFAVDYRRLFGESPSETLSHREPHRKRFA